MARSPRRIIHISKELDNYLIRKKLRRGKSRAEGYDALLRRLFGMRPQNTKHKYRPLKVFWVVPGANIACKRKNEALGESIKYAVMKKRKRITKAPIKVREVL